MHSEPVLMKIIVILSRCVHGVVAKNSVFEMLC